MEKNMKRIIFLSLFFLLILSGISYAQGMMKGHKNAGCIGTFNRMLAKRAYNALNPHHVGVKPNAVAVVGVPQIMAPALYKEYVTGHNNKHYYLLDVREHLAFVKMGHIPGAHNIPLQVLFTPKYLKMLPKHRTIISICYVGQWESMAAGLLATMGYHVKILRFGMSSWNPKIDLLHRNKVAFGNFALAH